MTTTATTSSPAFISRRSPIPTSLIFNNKSVYISSLRPRNIPLSSSSVASHVTRVTTAPIEYAPPAPEFHLSLEIKRLMNLKAALFGNPNLNLDHKIRIVESDSKVKQFFRIHDGLVSRIFASLSLSEYELYLVKCVVAAGQGHVISSGVFEVVRNSEISSTRGSLKSALYALVDIIEKWDGNRMSNGSSEMKTEALPLEREQVKALRDLLKTLANVEKFYDCIGGIIGYVVVNLYFVSTC